MTDRIAGFYVTLEKDMRTDDVEAVATALGMIKHVLRVDPHVADFGIAIAQNRARMEMVEKMIDILKW